MERIFKLLIIPHDSLSFRFKHQENTKPYISQQPDHQNTLKIEDMPSTRRSHTNGDVRPNGLCIHVITYGEKRGHAQIPIPKLVHVDCVQTEPPSLELREKYTGVDKELADVYWSNPLHVKLLEETLDQLEVKILDGPYLQGGCAAVVVNCMSGKHRSVAMAEKLADEIEQWDRIVVHREHLDTDVVSGQTRETRIEVDTHNDRLGTQGPTQERAVSSPEVEETGRSSIRE